MLLLAAPGRATTTDQAPKEGQYSMQHAASPPSALADLADEASDASIRLAARVRIARVRTAHKAPAAHTGSAVRVAGRLDTVVHPGRAAVRLVDMAARLDTAVHPDMVAAHSGTVVVRQVVAFLASLCDNARSAPIRFACPVGQVEASGQASFLASSQGLPSPRAWLPAAAPGRRRASRRSSARPARR